MKMRRQLLRIALAVLCMHEAVSLSTRQHSKLRGSEAAEADAIPRVQFDPAAAAQNVGRDGVITGIGFGAGYGTGHVVEYVKGYTQASQAWFSHSGEVCTSIGPCISGFFAFALALAHLSCFDHLLLLLQPECDEMIFRATKAELAIAQSNNLNLLGKWRK